MKKCLKKNPIVWVFTIVWVVGAVVFIARHNYCECCPLTLAEWGNFFAGVAAPIALVWLIIGHLETSKQVAMQGADILRHLKAIEKRNDIAEIGNDLKIAERNERDAQRKASVKPDIIDLKIAKNRRGSFKVINAIARDVKIICVNHDLRRETSDAVRPEETKDFGFTNGISPSDYPFEFLIECEDILKNKMRWKCLVRSENDIDVEFSYLED